MPGASDEEIKSNIIQLAKGPGVVLFATEIEAVVRLNWRDEKDVRPGPVIATFSRIFHRDSIITKKRALRNIPALSQVFINADEMLQVRRAKAILRRAAFIAPGDREELEARHDRIRINNDIYTVDNVNNLPQQHTVSISGEGAVGGETRLQKDNNLMQTEPIAKPSKRPQKFAIRRGEGMRISKHGLLFSGPSPQT